MKRAGKDGAGTDIGSIRNPDRIMSYFQREKWPLFVITVSGILYNAGMTAGPWFEGQLAQYLCDIIEEKRTFPEMAVLAVCYVLTILFVQGMRYIKRLYTRRFGNAVNRDLKQVLYRNLVHKKKTELESENAGAVMTKAIADVDACSEGMRKFTTEVFDTGVVMVAYLVMLFAYDWRLTLISMLFPPAAYLIAEALKMVVTKSAQSYKESAGRLNSATMDRVGNAMLYRVYGQEQNRDADYETCLTDYEKKAVRANLWETSMQPLYQIISMVGAVFILWFGAKNVLGSGWTNWNIAAFTTFLSCFTKLAVKSSKAAKLFNAVQKAQVSWRRIKPFLREIAPDGEKDAEQPAQLEIAGLSFAYPGGKDIFSDVSITVRPGEIVGVTGAVACGKSTFGRVFLGEYPYRGSIRYGGRELSALLEEGKQVVGYLGHQPELINADIAENVLMGNEEDVMPWLRAVCMDGEVKKMPEGIHTVIGSGGTGLSGGQQARVALARTLCQKRPVMILDDPFSAVDLSTEEEIMAQLRRLTKDCIVVILSHRLHCFPQMDQVLWMEAGRVTVSTHERLLRENAEYAHLYQAQTGGDQHEA